MFLQLQAKFPTRAAFVATPDQCRFARNQIGEIDDAQFLSHGKSLRYHGKAAFRTDIDSVALRTQAPARIDPLDCHRNSRIEASAAADVPHPGFKTYIFQKRHVISSVPGVEDSSRAGHSTQF